MQVGRDGSLQEWLEDWGQRRERATATSRNLYGVYPGPPDLGAPATPALADGGRRVLAQRGLVRHRLVVGLEGRGRGPGCGDGCAGARERQVYAVQQLHDGQPVLDLLRRHPQVDGALGIDRGDRGACSCSPTRTSWSCSRRCRKAGATARSRGCGRAAATRWASIGRRGALERATIAASRAGTCRVRAAHDLRVASGGKTIRVSRPERRLMEFPTTPGAVYTLEPDPRK